MVTSLGYSVEQACAAARAGLTRPQELDNFRYKREDDGEVEGLSAYPAMSIAMGFEGNARLNALVRPTVRDFLRTAPLRDREAGRTGLFLALPDPRKMIRSLELVSDPDLQSEIAGRCESLEDESELARQRKLQQCEIETALLQSLGIADGVGRAERFDSGSCTFGLAVAAAVESLGDGELDHAIVASFDSLISESDLSWLEACGRLKTANNPLGVCPGEAGVVVLLERYDSVAQAENIVLATVNAVITGDDSTRQFSGDQPTGLRLVEMLSDLDKKAAAMDGDQCPWIISDLNGEVFKAMEWGRVLVQLFDRNEDWSERIVWTPIASFGDTGVSATGVALCCSVEAFRRGYAPGNLAFVVTSGEDGSRSVLSIGAPETEHFAEGRRNV